MSKKEISVRFNREMSGIELNLMGLLTIDDLSLATDTLSCAIEMLKTTNYSLLINARGLGLFDEKAHEKLKDLFSIQKSSATALVYHQVYFESLPTTVELFPNCKEARNWLSEQQ